MVRSPQCNWGKEPRTTTNSRLVKGGSSNVQTLTFLGIFYLPHDSLGPLNGCRNYAISPRTVPRIEQILSRFEVPRHEYPGNDPNHPFPSFVHWAIIHLRFLFVYGGTGGRSSFPESAQIDGGSLFGSRHRTCG